MTTTDRIRSFDRDEWPRVDRLFRHAQAYLYCSQQAFDAMATSNMPKTFEHVCAAAHLFEHALELFFKGSIMSATGEQVTGHNLHKLHKKFQEIFRDRFTFTSDIERFTEWDTPWSHSEYTRYPFDRKGQKWPQPLALNLQRAVNETSSLKQDFNKIIHEICGTTHDQMLKKTC